MPCAAGQQYQHAEWVSSNLVQQGNPLLASRQAVSTAKIHSNYQITLKIQKFHFIRKKNSKKNKLTRDVRLINKNELYAKSYCCGGLTV